MSHWFGVLRGSFWQLGFLLYALFAAPLILPQVADAVQNPREGDALNYPLGLALLAVYLIDIPALLIGLRIARRTAVAHGAPTGFPGMGVFLGWMAHMVVSLILLASAGALLGFDMSRPEDSLIGAGGFSVLMFAHVIKELAAFFAAAGEGGEHSAPAALFAEAGGFLSACAMYTVFFDYVLTTTPLRYGQPAYLLLVEAPIVCLFLAMALVATQLPQLALAVSHDPSRRRWLILFAVNVFAGGLWPILQRLPGG